MYAGVYLRFSQLQAYKHDRDPDAFRFPADSHRHLHEGMDLRKTIDPSRSFDARPSHPFRQETNGLA